MEALALAVPAAEAELTPADDVTDEPGVADVEAEFASADDVTDEPEVADGEAAGEDAVEAGAVALES